MESNKFSLTNIALVAIVLLSVFLVGILIFGPNAFQAGESGHTAGKGGYPWQMGQ
jgi:hypothetical protein